MFVLHMYPRIMVELRSFFDRANPSNTTHVGRSNLDLLISNLSEFSALVTVSTFFNLARAFPTGDPQMACLCGFVQCNELHIQCSSLSFLTRLFHRRGLEAFRIKCIQEEASSPTEARPIEG